MTRAIGGLRERIRQRRLDRAARAHSLRVSRVKVYSVQGSDHTHLIRRGF